MSAHFTDHIMIWYQLVNWDGSAFKNSSTDCLLISPSINAAQLRDAVKAKNSNLLANYDANQLAVCLKSDSIHTIRPSSHVCDLGGDTYDDALLVLVPEPVINGEPQIGTQAVPRHPMRVRRWNALNAILARVPQMKKKRGEKGAEKSSIAFSNVKWQDVKAVFATVHCTLPRAVIDEVPIKLLSDYLGRVHVCSPCVADTNEAKRLHFIAPIMYTVGSLFKGEIMVTSEEPMRGHHIHAHGQFEFTICRGKRQICVVEVQKNDLDQGRAQDLLGCEVAADVGGLDMVFGIVTDYFDWVFLRSLNDRIEEEKISLILNSDGIPSLPALAEVSGIIYAMLSDSE